VRPAAKVHGAVGGFSRNRGNVESGEASEERENRGGRFCSCSLPALAERLFGQADCESPLRSATDQGSIGSALGNEPFHDGEEMRHQKSTRGDHQNTQNLHNYLHLSQITGSAPPIGGVRPGDAYFRGRALQFNGWNTQSM
jgi:hypothetical protein